MSAVETRLCGRTSQIQRMVIALIAPPAGSSGPVERQLVAAGGDRPHERRAVQLAAAASQPP